MKIRVSQIAIIILSPILFLSFQNCAKLVSSDHDERLASLAGPPPLVPFSSVTPILGTHCASCHSPGSGVTSNLTNVLDEQELISKGFVVMGDPQISPMYLMIMDGIEPRIPVGATTTMTVMADYEVAMLRDYILGPDLINDNLGGGASGGTGGTVIPATYANIQAQVIGPNCLGCHANYSNYQELLNRVTPRNINSSVLYTRLNRTDALRMPQAPNQPLDGALRDLVARWINAGAPP